MEKNYFVEVFDQGDSGELFRLDQPQQFDSEAQAREAANDLASKHAGVIAWSLNLESSTEFEGEREVFYTAGETLELE